MRNLPSTIESLSERLAKLTADETTAEGHAGDPIIIAGRKYPRDDAPAALARELDKLLRHISETHRVPLGIYRGLKFGLLLHPQIPSDVYLEGKASRHSMLSRDHQGPRAVLNALDRLANGYGSECARIRQELAIAESQLRDYHECLGKPFPHEAYLSKLTDLRDQLKAKLSAGHDFGEESGPTTSELAEQIKTLKAANTIEAVPQRTTQKHTAAAEPITARIRRSQKINPAHDPAIEAANGSVAKMSSSLEAENIQSAKPQLLFQQRIATERLRQDNEPTMP